MPQLVDPDTIEEDGFVVDYKKWGEAATDAPAEYHELTCFIALSALTSAGLKLETYFGDVIPNLWGLVLGESTLTRKTTAMRMAMDIVSDIEESAIVATDGSAEGLLSSLGHRPRRVSVFYKDEVSGFFDQINRKDYLAGMPETLTQLYDVPKIMQRVLKKETITITEPYFIFFGGGIKDKVYGLIDEEYILSGFLPRFLIVTGETDITRFRRTGPATENTWDLKQKVISGMGELKVAYNLSAPMEIAGQQMLMPARIEAKLTQDAWNLFGDYEEKLVNAARDSPDQMLAMPTFTRLAMSLLKIGMLTAITRREPKDNNTIIVEESDIKQSAFYIQRWGRHSIDLIMNAGKPFAEKLFDKVYKNVKDEPGIMKSLVMRRWRISAKEMKDVIDTLEQRGLIYHQTKSGATRLYPVV
jgi:ribosomal protein S25